MVVRKKNYVQKRLYGTLTRHFCSKFQQHEFWNSRSIKFATIVVYNQVYLEKHML
jgi:hypothetical protein